MKLYGIYDKIADEYIGLFTCKNDEVAMRGLSSIEKNDPRCSSDFVLVCLGDISGRCVASEMEMTSVSSDDPDFKIGTHDNFIVSRELGNLYDLVIGDDDDE